MTIRFIDLFAGIGGFHSAGEAFGWQCVFASEIDPAAAKIYESNWGLTPSGDIKEFTTGSKRKTVPDHDVLFAGFPCQPFSKSGKQLGMEEDRGSLFHDILRILKEKKPSMFVLENVRNLSGPRHEHEWNFIIRKLRGIGYTVSSEPFIVSPHRIPPSYGGTPQARERVFITGTRTEKPVKDKIPNLAFPTDFEFWDESSWNLYKDLPIVENDKETFLKFRISHEEVELLEAWDSLIRQLKTSKDMLKLPGFPLWSDLWGKKQIYEFDELAPEWKRNFEDKNLRFYKEHKTVIDNWLKQHSIIRESPPSKRKFEWQAQDLPSLWDGLIHFRPSGIRVKKANYVPALVAITQTTILGKYRRRITPREAARLQGLNDDFTFFNQSDSLSYKQLGNGVSVGAVYQVVKALAKRDYENLLNTNRELLASIEKSASSPKPRFQPKRKSVHKITGVNPRERVNTKHSQ